jgi:hypothetical protein
VKNGICTALMAAFMYLGFGSAYAHAEKCNLGAEVPRHIALAGDVVVIFRDEQCFGVYENGRIASRDMYDDGWYVHRTLHGWASTGTDTNETPLSDPSTGTQRVLRSSRDHRSKEIQIKVGGRWVDAPMPFALFFDEKGRAIHAGNVRRERASHGCVRIPPEAARALFDGFDHRSLQIIIARNRHEFQERWEGASVVDTPLQEERQVRQEFRWNGREFFPTDVFR